MGEIGFGQTEKTCPYLGNFRYGQTLKVIDAPKCLLGYSLQTKMKKTLLLLTILASFTYGLVVGKYEVFPYRFISFIKNKSNIEGPRSDHQIQREELFKEYSPEADIVFLGDSITSQGIWNEFFPSYRIVNRGIGGETTSDIVKRLDTVLSTKPSKVFVMVGINDLAKDFSVRKIIKSYDLLISKLTENGINVIIQSTIQCSPTEKYVRSVNELNNKLKKLSESKKVKFLDLEELSSENGLDSKYTYDGIHLTSEGYIYWVKKIRPLLEG